MPLTDILQQRVRARKGEDDFDELFLPDIDRFVDGESSNAYERSENERDHAEDSQDGSTMNEDEDDNEDKDKEVKALMASHPNCLTYS